MPAADEPSHPKSATPIRARHFRAPQGDEEALIEPPLAHALELIGRNRSRLNQPIEVGRFRDLSHVRRWFSRQFFHTANALSKRYRDVSFDLASLFDSDPIVIVAGHQPELFHPGVWLKSFVLDRLGRLPNAVAVNLVIDNDVAGSNSVRTPIGSLDQPSTIDVPFDAVGEAIPFEERNIISSETLSNFPAALREQLAHSSLFSQQQVSNLLADRLWGYIGRGNSEEPLGTNLAQGRHRLEQDFGLQTLEIPLSYVVSSPDFCSFAVPLLQGIDRFRSVYNSSLQEYRIVNRIRSQSHPVPELVVDGDWFEAPFWIWSTSNPRRLRLFVRNYRDANGNEVIDLTDRGSEKHAFTRPADQPEFGWFNCWNDLASRGVKIRPRALITTMYARLFLSDLFIHGIGGAKYDELTDAIIRRFFGIEPPEYLTVTGTVRLPIPRPTTTAADVRNTKQLIREIRFHPEKFINHASPAIRESATQFAEKKKELLREHQFHFLRATPEQFRALDDLNRQLSVLLTDVEIRLRDELKTREREAHDNKLLGSREFSFVLHPADELPDQLKRMAQGTHYAPS